MSVLVSDTSIIIDLDRGDMLEQMFQLPYEFCVPDLLFEQELKGELGDRLIACGLDVVELSPEELTEAMSVHQTSGKLSYPDAFALILAKERKWTLLTGDGAMRRLAHEQELVMHGVLWVVEEYHRLEVMAPADLHRCLTAISVHERCRLPMVEIRRLLTQFSADE
ncbi:MAG: PIN domain-containing protein [Planctomycetaceae bacterium]|nr:PIN domain-containing protein [Planctomycetaceae bacterium]